MRRGMRLAAIGAGLWATLLPGCALLGQRTPAQPEIAKPCDSSPRSQEDRGTRRPAVLAEGLAIEGPAPSADPPVAEHRHATGSAPSARRVPAAVDPGPAEAEAEETPPGHEVPRPAQAAPRQPSVVYQAAPTPKMEPLVEALDWLLKNQPAKALDLLKSYPPSSQDVYMRLLPVLAQLSHKSADQLSPEEVSAMHEQLCQLTASLRAQAPLVIDRICFCQSIHGFGQCQPLPADHEFRAHSADGPGESVMLYVELRNFSLVPCAEGFVTLLSSSIAITDAAGNKRWEHSFQDREPPIVKQSSWHDCMGNYVFFMPQLPAGTYTLTITICDRTRPDRPRTARKSLPMRVGS